MMGGIKIALRRSSASCSTETTQPPLLSVTQPCSQWAAAFSSYQWCNMFSMAGEREQCLSRPCTLQSLYAAYIAIVFAENSDVSGMFLFMELKSCIKKQGSFRQLHDLWLGIIAASPFTLFLIFPYSSWVITSLHASCSHARTNPLFTFGGSKLFSVGCYRIRDPFKRFWTCPGL